MYIETVPNRNSKPCILLRESSRDGRKVLKKTIANITNWPPTVVENLKAILKGGIAIAQPEDSFEILRSIPYGHVAAVLSVMRKLDIERIIEPEHSRQRDLVAAMIAARITEPQSKLATARSFDIRTCSNTLAEEFDLGCVDEDELYAAMDWLFCRQESVENVLANRHLHEGTFVLYDLTSTYFEGKKCPLARLGHNRDKKKGKLQIEFGLLCDTDGRPVAVEVFEGNVGDPSTLSVQLDKIRRRFGLKRVVIVGDRGMLTEARIRNEIKNVEGLEWISALRSPAIRKLVRNDHIRPSLFDDYDLAEITSPDFPNERLMVCRNPLLVGERRRKREELIKATEEKLEIIVKAIERKTKPLRGKSEIGLRVGKVLNKHKVGKHFSIRITYASLKYERKTEKIREEAALDGFYVIRTSLPKEAITAEKTVTAYKRLSVVERAFRSIKTVDLKVRPIHHHLENRVRSHVLLCVLAYHVEWHMRESLKALLFDDEDDIHPLSVVMPAERSSDAKHKSARKQTKDGLPIHSFHTLMKDLATVTKNKIRFKISGSLPFDMITRPTQIQKKAFDLLGVSL